MNALFPRIALLLSLTLAGCQTSVMPRERSGSAIRAVLDQQVRDWNAGNLSGFMEGYAKSEQTRFASGGDISLGWQTVFDRYQEKYGTGATMGTLRFSDVEITSFDSGTALAFGRWHLQRSGETSSGLFTLLFRKAPEGWRIVHDHTSAAAKQ
jgi:ketosteroid isomerase-like protein